MDLRPMCKIEYGKLMDENLAEHFLTEITTALFLDPSPKVKEMKAKINKWATQVALLVKNLPAKAEDIRGELGR